MISIGVKVLNPLDLDNLFRRAFKLIVVEFK